MRYDWPLIGHQHIKDYFVQTFGADKIHHAYLFEGPKQVGKATFARMLAKTILCESKILDAQVPCGNCRACKNYDNNAHPDVLELTSGESAHISIDAAREFISSLSTYPLLGRRRIGIIENAEDFMVAAGNALLKTLEEPSKSVVLFLITSRELLPTIASRCQRVRFNFVPLAQIEQGLGPLLNGKMITSLSAGRPGRALELQADNAHQEYEDKSHKLLDILKDNESKKFLWATEQFGSGGNLAERRELLQECLNIFEAILRDGIFLCVRRDPNSLQHIFMKDELARFVQQVSFSEIMRMIKSITSARQMVYANVDPRLIAEYVLAGEALSY